jgi:hypothetical protein
MSVLSGVFLVPCLNLVPNHKREGAVFAKVDSGLRCRKTKATLGLVWLAPGGKHVRSEELPMQG